MIYRAATTNDLKEIIEMKNKVKQRVINENLPIWLNGYPLDEYIEEDILNKHGRVIVLNNEIIAYAAFYLSTDDYPIGTFKHEPVQSFGRLMVKDEYLGQKVGSFLVDKMIEEAKTLNVLGLGILVDDINTKAVSLYKKKGFVKEGSNQFPYAYLDIYALYFNKE